jgi:hypothetical protein
MSSSVESELKVQIDSDTLEIRVYAESTEDLRAACVLCKDYASCDGSTAMKPCMGWCG